MAKYKVDVMRINYASIKSILVVADTSREARAKALKKAKTEGHPVSDERIEYEVDDCLLIYL